jgi:hypothetical protein
MPIELVAGEIKRLDAQLYPVMATLVGYVTDADTGTMIDSVKVTVGGKYVGTTGDNGIYEVPYIIPGTYKADFWDTKGRYGEVTVPSVQIPKEGATLNVQMQMVPPGAIAVTADPPEEDVKIRVTFWREGVWRTLKIGYTDAGGQCMLEDIPPGDYRVVAEHVEYETAEKSVTVYSRP